jgi:hypothetical protein
MQQEVVPYTVAISQLGQKAYFQIRLPHDTKRIIGLEYGIMPDEGAVSIPPAPTINPYLQIQANELYGRLVLQVPGVAGIFYQGDIIKDRNIQFGENIAFAFLPAVANIHFPSWHPALWTHGRKREEFMLQVDNADFVEGLFWNTKTEADPYNLHIYLWTEKCNP